MGLAVGGGRGGERDKNLPLPFMKVLLGPLIWAIKGSC